MERIDELAGPPQVGRFYLVPTVWGVWDRKLASWPVIGPQHNDKHCLNFKHQHYHLDARFLRIGDGDYWAWRMAFATPLQVNSRVNTDGLPAPVLKRRKCQRIANPFLEDIRASASKDRGFQCMFDAYEGRQARHDGVGWVCPHRQVRLADHPAVDGIITCPLHMLRINAATGKVVP